MLQLFTMNEILVWGFFSLHKLDFLQMKLNKIAIYCGVLVTGEATLILVVFDASSSYI